MGHQCLTVRRVVVAVGAAIIAVEENIVLDGRLAGVLWAVRFVLEYCHGRGAVGGVCGLHRRGGWLGGEERGGGGGVGGAGIRVLWCSGRDERTGVMAEGG